MISTPYYEVIGVACSGPVLVAGNALVSASPVPDLRDLAASHSQTTPQTIIYPGGGVQVSCRGQVEV